MTSDVITVEHAERGPLSRDEMAQLVARDIPAGAFVNFGIGQPTRVSDYLDPGSGVIIHTENGMLGMGPEAHDDEIDPDLINAASSRSPSCPARRTSTTPTRSR